MLAIMSKVKKAVGICAGCRSLSDQAVALRDQLCQPSAKVVSENGVDEAGRIRLVSHLNHLLTCQEQQGHGGAAVGSPSTPTLTGSYYY
jgi:hypothetical protein